MTTDQTPIPAEDIGLSLLIDLRVLATLLDRSEASLERDLPAGRLPAPVWLGGSRKWRRKEIEAWVDAGCPTQAEWEDLRRD
jgi:predicted DNA-binding transcriptional regulator AlpA